MHLGREKKGYTFVELVIVIVLLMLLAAGLTFGAAKWIETINFSRQNETARTLYTIAQNQLTEYSQSGQLEAFQEKLKNNRGQYENSVPVSVLVSPEGLPYSLSGKDEEGKVNLWPSSFAGNKTGIYQGEICFLKGKPEDYEKYLKAKNGSGTVDKKIEALYGLFEEYLYDTSVLKDGIVCVEVAPEDGQVFAVLYSDIAEDFTYIETADKRGMVSINDRTTPYRRARMVGYYGVDTLYKATSTKLAKPSILNLRLNNEETLNLSFEIGKVPDAANNMQYEITVVEKETKRIQLKFYLDGTKLKKRESRETISCEVTRYIYLADGSMREQYIGDYPILAWIEGTLQTPQVRIVFDAADLGATTYAYKDAYECLTTQDSITKETENSVFTSAKAGVLKQTLSFRRFGLTELEDIYCTVKGKGEFYKQTAEKQSNAENTAFASYKKVNSMTTYTLRNARHLYNMRYLEDFTKEELQNILPASEESHTTVYRIAANMDWAYFVSQENLFRNAQLVEQSDFPSIRKLQANARLERDGKNNTISGLTITAATNMAAGVYEDPKDKVSEEAPADESGSEERSVQAYADADKAAGLFLVNCGTIEGVVLDKIKVTGGTCVGAFCGVNAGTLTNLQVKNTDHASKITGFSNVGGILGTHKAVDAAGAGIEQETVLEKLVNYARITERTSEPVYVTAGGRILTDSETTLEGADGETTTISRMPANVSKRENFGGIVGSLVTDSAYLKKVTVQSCTNYGRTEAADAVHGAYTEALGGIVGRTNATAGGSIVIEGCSSSPQYEDVSNLTSSLQSRLKGKYVGGIVGYNNGASITACNTRKERSSKEGYVFGAEYVGGIVGLNEVTQEGAGSRIDGTVAYLGTQKRSENQVHVIGKKYVGGIVGGNPRGVIVGWLNEGFVGATKEYAGGITGYNDSLPGEAKSGKAQLVNCSSQIASSKAVLALSREKELLKADFVGGITGYNNGYIGQNAAGESMSNRTISLVSSVTGANYVGGVVGYNDVDAVICNYSVSGGNIVGSGSFVGGFCGLNASVNMLQAAGNAIYHIVSNPNKVEGNYCVGGVIGANVIPAVENAQIPCSLLTDNFLGELFSHGGFAGGYIGYNRLVSYVDAVGRAVGRQESGEYSALPLVDDAIRNVTRQMIMVSARQTCVRLAKLDAAKQKIADPTVSEEVKNTAEEQKQSALADPDTLLFIEFADHNIKATEMVMRKTDGSGLRALLARMQENLQARLGSVRAPMYVGGVVGYNAAETQLQISGVTNKTPIEATEYIESARGYLTYTGEKKKFSFAGGIIGKVSRNVVVEECRNQDTGTVTSKGTYTGSICEINEGTIRDCAASSIGSSTNDYVGGIAGINNVGAVIENCMLEKGRTITGQNYVGGIAAENYGLIICPVVKGTIKAYGEYGCVGGVAGFNKKVSTDEKAGVILLKSDGKTGEGVLGLTVSSAGRYVGGIVGLNEGMLQKEAASEAENTGTAGGSGVQTVTVQGTVDGKDCVGGIVGRNGAITLDEKPTEKQSLQISNELSGYISTAAVKASNGYAGGIVGESETGSGRIAACLNVGEVTAVEGGCAGGIVAVNRSTVENCVNTAEIHSPNGVCGGISAVNGGGTLTESEDSSAAGTQALTESAGTSIAGTQTLTESTGTSAETAIIRNCVVAPKNNGTLVFRGKAHAGGICGINYGRIVSSDVAGIELNDLADSEGSMLGGITAENKAGATIENCQVGSIRSLAENETENTKAGEAFGMAGIARTADTGKVMLKSYAFGGSMGGVTGVNAGNITGAAPENGGSAEQTAYTSVRAELSFTATEQAYYGNMGGVAGVNSGTIRFCTFSGKVAGTGNNPQKPPQYNPTTDNETSGAVIYGYGGIAGINGSSADKTPGTIEDCAVKAAKITGLGDATNVANIGGIAGVNGTGGMIARVRVGTDETDGETYQASLAGETNVLKINDRTYSVYVGTESSTGAYVHAGGITGLNSGKITQIGYAFAEKASGASQNGETTGASSTAAADETVSMPQTSSELDGTSVLIEAYRGHIGGITGYNRRTGLIEKAATGSGWVVYSVNNAQDNGCGGIIGYQAGEQGLRYCVNAAKVVKTTTDSNGVGGMVGRMEVATAKNYLISQCINFGDIYGYARVGGMVGVAKYYGGTFSDCINYGTISVCDKNKSKGGNNLYAGGILGMSYDISTSFGALSFTACENHGTVNGYNYSAGIIGGARGSTKILAADCVNTGLIDVTGSETGTYGSGISGVGSGQLNAASSFVRCRNYGYSKKGKIGGILTNQTDFNTNVILQQNFGLAALDYPIANRKNFSNATANYYLTKSLSGQDVITKYDKDGNKTADDAPIPFYVKSVEAPNISGPENLYKITADATDNSLNDGGRAYFSTNDKSKEWSYTFTFSREIDLRQIDLWWFRGGYKNRVQNYTIYYSSYMEGAYSEFATVTNIGKVSSNDLKKQQESVSRDSAVTARRIKIVITDSVENGSGNENGKSINACLARIHFRDETKLAAGTTGYYQYTWKSGNTYSPLTDFAGMSYELANKKVTYQGYAYEIAEEGVPSVDRGTGEETMTAFDGTSYALQTKQNGSMISVVPSLPMDLSLLMEQQAKTSEELEATGASKSNIRYQIYKANDKWLYAAKENTIVELGAPKDVHLDSAAGGVKAYWTAVGSAAYYRYEAVFYDKDGNVLRKRTDTVYGTSSTSVELPAPDVNGSKVQKIGFRVQAGADTVKDGAPSQVWSAYTAEIFYEMTEVLPIPAYHLELVINRDTLSYRAFLDNREEYVAFLENLLTDGEKKPSKETLEAELGKIMISVYAGDTKRMSFSVKDGKSEASYGGQDSNIIFSADASYKWGTGAEEKKMNSFKALRESPALTYSAYTGGKKANVFLTTAENSEVGFHGDTTETLRYQVKMKILEKVFIVYMRSELVATDLLLGIPVSVSSSEIRLSDTTTDFVATELASLPTELLNEKKYKDLLVRSYPVVMTNNVVYNGHDVSVQNLPDTAAGVTAEILERLYVTADNYAVYLTEEQAANTELRKLITNESNGSKKLASGFVVRLLEDGTYSLYYNTLLDFNERQGGYTSNANANKTQMKTQVYYYSIPMEQMKKQPVPVIHYNFDDTTGTDGDPNKDVLTVTWDLDKKGYESKESQKSNYKKGAVYSYTVTGYTPDTTDQNGTVIPGTAVQIAAGEYTTGKTGENTLTFSTTSWNYTKVKIAISRYGETKANGVTNLFPSSSEKEIDLKLSLSQIASPTVALHTENGIVQKNTLLYDVTWNAIPKAEREALAAYEITAKRNESDKACVKTYGTKEAYEAALESLKALYAERSGQNEPAETKAADESGVEWTKLTWSCTQTGAAGETIQKEMTLLYGKLPDDSWQITQEMTIRWNFPVSDENEKRNAASLTETIDLKDFERGAALGISVRAIADSDKYRNGPDGVEAEMTLPSRLSVPVIDAAGTGVHEMKAEPAYTAAGFMTIEQIEKSGLQLFYQAANVEDTNGNYEIAAAVYEAEPTEEELADMSAVAAGDALDGKPGETPERWNTGAYITLVSKAEPIRMEGNLEEASCTLDNLSREYGGKWLKIAMRSISDNNISSVWADEDEAALQTVNYAWVRIPRVQEETPYVQTGDTDLKYNLVKEETDETEKYVYTEEDLGTAETAKQMTLTYQLTQLADHYRIALVRKEKAADELQGYTVKYTDWIYLEQDLAQKGTWRVFYASSDPSFDAAAWEEQQLKETGLSEALKSVLCKDAVYLGEIAPGAKQLLLPYSGEVMVSESDEHAEWMKAVSWIKCETAADGNNTVIELLLPDTSVFGSRQIREEYGVMTEQVSVQGVIDKGSAAEDTDNTGGNRAYYEDSQIALWYRQDGQSFQTVLEKAYAAPEALRYTLEAPDGTGRVTVTSASGSVADMLLVTTGGTAGSTPMKLQITGAKEWLVLDMRVLDEKGQELGQRYMSCYGTGTTDIDNIVWIPADLWGYARTAESTDSAVTQTFKLRVSAAFIVRSVGCRGISQWSQESTFENLQVTIQPEEPTPTEEPKVSEEPKPTEEPKVSEEPKPTEEPKVSEEPKPTEEPTGTEEPTPTEETKAEEEPTGTEETKPTEEPKAGEEPTGAEETTPPEESKAEEEPTGTEETKPTEEPKVSEETKPTEEPKVSEEPKPTGETKAGEEPTGTEEPIPLEEKPLDTYPLAETGQADMPAPDGAETRSAEEQTFTEEKEPLDTYPLAETGQADMPVPDGAEIKSAEETVSAETNVGRETEEPKEATLTGEPKEETSTKESTATEETEEPTQETVLLPDVSVPQRYGEGTETVSGQDDGNENDTEE